MLVNLCMPSFPNGQRFFSFPDSRVYTKMELHHVRVGNLGGGHRLAWAFRVHYCCVPCIGARVGKIGQAWNDTSNHRAVYVFEAFAVVGRASTWFTVAIRCSSLGVSTVNHGSEGQAWIVSKQKASIRVCSA